MRCVISRPASGAGFRLDLRPSRLRLARMSAQAGGGATQECVKELFPNTLWAVVSRARHGSASALETLFSTYREPLLVFLRCRGMPHQDAEDTVQGFAEHLLERDFLANVAPVKGRFRTFLLTALQRYLADTHARDTAAKRGGGRPTVSLDETDAEGRPQREPTAPNARPDLEFDRAWARTTLRNALQRLAAECASKGKAGLWLALEPALFADETTASYADLAQEIGLSVGAIKMAMQRLKRRLAGLIREAILRTVDNPEDLDDELRYLLSLWDR